MNKEKYKKVLKQIEKKSRAKYECPQELLDLIKLVNLVPLNIEMSEHPYWTVGKVVDKSEIDWNEKIKFFYSYVESLGEDFRNYINSFFDEPFPSLGGQVPFLDYVVRRQAYEKYFHIREDVRKFTQHINRERKGDAVDLEDEPLRISALILKDKNGKDFLDGFAGLIGKFQSDRLRICEICSRIFWAKRKESETCSKRCFNNLRQRRSRNLSDEEKEKRKAQREANRERNKKLKEIRSKKNGTL